MDVTGLLLGLAILVVVLAVVARPLVGGSARRGARRPRPRSAQARRMDKIAHLLEQRNAVYAEILALDEDYATGKVSPEDYTQQRRQLVDEGVSILMQLDRLQAAAVSPQDPLEARIAAMRRRAGGRAAGVPEAAPGNPRPEPAANGNFTCPACGAPASRRDRFCGACGETLGGGELTCLECGSSYRAGDLYCASCGAALQAQG